MYLAHNNRDSHYHLCAFVVKMKIIFQLKSMKGKWSFGQFALSEAETLSKGISAYIDNDGELEE